MEFKLNSIFNRLMNIILGAGVLFFIGLHNSYATQVNATVNQGFVPVGAFSGTVTVPKNTYFNSTDALAAGFAFAPNAVGGNYCASYIDSWKTIDGYYGYEVTTGILLVIYNTNISGNVVSSTGGAVGVNGSFNAYGVLSGTIPPKTNSVNCYSYLTQASSTTSETITQINGQYGYYISSNAVEGSISPTKIAMRRMNGYGSTYGDYIVINNADSLIIKARPKIACSISAPPTINFNKIHLTGNEKDGDILAYNNGNVSLNCSSDDQTATANTTISITGNKGRYTDTLALSGTSASAEIRGVIGSPIPPTGSCSAKGDGYTNFINFSEGAPIDVGKINVGTNLIPYSFTLCSKGVYALGEATATARLDINWE